MKTFFIVIGLLIGGYIPWAQPVAKKLDKAMQQLLADSAMKHASISLYVVDSKTNEAVYNYNSQLGLAPASCQKIITSVAAFELLGNEYSYKTELGYDGEINNGILKGNLHLTGSGDPTLGSWRYNATKDSTVLDHWMEAIKKAGIKKIDGNLFFNGTKYSFQPLPGGWIWDDIGNYYGAGTWGLNWHENQYDLVLQPGENEGGEVYILQTKPEMQKAFLRPILKTGKKGSGDNSYIYLAPNSSNGFVDGTVPAGEKTFTVSGAMPNPVWQLQKAFEDKLGKENIGYKSMIDMGMMDDKADLPKPATILQTHISPTLDSINFWFLKKSINLYGEALVKTMGYEKNGEGSTNKGVDVVRKFWQDRGIEKGALRISDGSGLSPQNRVTTDALVKALQYASDKKWFPSFYNALPIYNGMKLKSGTIGGCKGFAGYHTSKAGVGYTIAVIVNNFEGASAAMVKKLFVVLDELK